MTSGFAVMAFGVWGIVKMAIFYLTAPDRINDLLAQAGMEGSSVAAKVLFFVFFLIFASIDMFIRIHVGRTARNEAMGKFKIRKHGRKKGQPKRSSGYLVIAGILSVLLLVGIIINIVSSGYSESSSDTMAASAVLDITSLFALVEMMRATFKVRKLTKAEELTAGEQTYAG